ncbi:glycoside hydrolase superfamily [Penicillium verhagenii]|uniref:glycoside hydrolase superfamily n=1 Tax=Penicillium verhagenii TaxID=1562060 RepID=UPI002544D43A|nr:glycoside hydrolase superfamily [Penicillium verhagenii]KAJ5947096.1 glycoside hydrolase superfamily [Penicillium verhagenii]
MPGVFSRLVAPTVFLWALSNLPSTHAVQTTTITTDLYPQIWAGWGVSLAWWANIFGDREDLADVVFSLDSTYWSPGSVTLPGLGLNILRYNAGACSWNTINSTVKMVPSANIPASKQMEGYWLDGLSTDPSSSSWNWTVDANQRTMMLNAQARGADTFELFSNSPMWWQLSNLNPSGASGGGSNLPASQYQNHAIYLSTIALYAQENWGITFTSIEAFNEPASDWWVSTGTQEGCHFDAASQAALIPILHEEMKARGLDSTVIASSDENTFELALEGWDTITKATEKADVGRVNTHGYEALSGPRSDLRAAATSAGQELWDSEYGDSDDTGATLVQVIMDDIILMQPNAWVHWQAVDSSDWGLITGDITTATLDGATTKYYMLAQFSRHIRSGMQFLNSTSSNVVPAINQDNDTLVIVAANWDAEETFTFDLSAFAEIPDDGTAVSSWLTDTSGDSLYASASGVVIENKSISLSIPSDTVQTFEIYGVKI